jgi:hypothetical protein
MQINKRVGERGRNENGVIELLNVAAYERGSGFVYTISVFNVNERVIICEAVIVWGFVWNTDDAD